MELVPVFRFLRRRWRRIALGSVVAILLAVAIGGSPTPALGYAKVQVIVDTPQSVVVDAAPGGIDTLFWRATVLGLMLGTNSSRQEIAHGLGVPVDQLQITNSNLASPALPTALPVAATQAATTPSNYSLTVTTDNVLPVVQIEATAPGPGGARNLALAAVRVLQSGTSPRTTPAVQGLDVRAAGPVQTRIIPGGAGHTKMAETAVAILVIWCLFASLGGALLRRTRRFRSARPVLS